MAVVPLRDGGVLDFAGDDVCGGGVGIGAELYPVFAYL